MVHDKRSGRARGSAVDVDRCGTALAKTASV